jgi:hypothetical protein
MNKRGKNEVWKKKKNVRWVYFFYNKKKIQLMVNERLVAVAVVGLYLGWRGANMRMALEYSLLTLQVIARKEKKRRGKDGRRGRTTKS